jgi:predicted TIM-barrel fold metal-dependent hydrolase
MNIDCYCVLGKDREYDLTAAVLLKEMDVAGVNRALIAPVDRYLAVENKVGNDFIAKQARAYPERFIATCSANPWYGKAAIQEFHRAINNGARMLIMHPFLQGYLANDEIVWPLMEAASQEQVPVYFHTGQPGNSTPWQLVDLAERFPVLDLIMGHSGTTDFWFDVMDAAKASPNIYLESSLARPFSFPERVQILGNKRIIMGSYVPINKLIFEWEQMRLALPLDTLECILGENLRRLLEKRGAL